LVRALYLSIFLMMFTYAVELYVSSSRLQELKIKQKS
jgi:hypothetical protein